MEYPDRGVTRCARRLGARALALCAALSASAALAGELPTIGWVEPVRIEGTGLLVEAKIDTGADYSSLDARDIKAFEKDGSEWVSFAAVGRGGKRVTVERRIYRYATIDRAGGSKQRRPVVLLGLCLGSVYRVVQVNLVDRGTLEYRMLVGRDFLQGRYLVDSARTQVTTPSCSETGKPKADRQ
jgi:hypothetical protein